MGFIVDTMLRPPEPFVLNISHSHIMRRDWGRIPYQIREVDFERPQIDDIHVAIDKWNSSTCISLVPREGYDGSYVEFAAAEDSCTSDVGCVRGKQTIGCNLEAAGRTWHSVMHEIGHAVGLIHEHQRPDRDEYVTIDQNVIGDVDHRINPQYGEGGNEREFRGDTYHCPYDYGSVMHGKLSTVTPPRADIFIGQREKLSDGDIEIVVKAYRMFFPPA